MCAPSFFKTILFVAKLQQSNILFGRSKYGLYMYYYMHQHMYECIKVDIYLIFLNLFIYYYPLLYVCNAIIEPMVIFLVKSREQGLQSLSTQQGFR